MNFAFQIIGLLYKFDSFAVLTLVLLRFLPFIRYGHANIIEVAYVNSNCSLY